MGASAFLGTKSELMAFSFVQVQRRFSAPPSVTRLSDTSSFYRVEIKVQPLSPYTLEDDLLARLDKTDKGSKDSQRILRKREEVDTEGEGNNETSTPAGELSEPAEGADDIPDQNSILETRQEASKNVLGIKLVSRDRKSHRVRVCGWEIDGWIV